jgi:excisionase family DNA binding protein
MNPNPNLPREGFTVSEAGAMAGLGRTKIYEEISEGRLKARKCGKRTIILKDELRQFLESLPLSKPLWREDVLDAHDEARAVAAAAAAPAQSLVLPATAPANESTVEIISVPPRRQPGTKSKTKAPEKKPAPKRRQALAEHEQEHETEMTS